jgi:hypothetical protein
VSLREDTDFHNATRLIAWSGRTGTALFEVYLSALLKMEKKHKILNLLYPLKIIAHFHQMHLLITTNNYKRLYLDGAYTQRLHQEEKTE